MISRGPFKPLLVSALGSCKCSISLLGVLLQARHPDPVRVLQLMF